MRHIAVLFLCLISYTAHATPFMRYGVKGMTEGMEQGARAFARSELGRLLNKDFVPAENEGIMFNTGGAAEVKAVGEVQVQLTNGSWETVATTQTAMITGDVIAEAAAIGATVLGGPVAGVITGELTRLGYEYVANNGYYQKATTTPGLMHPPSGPWETVCLPSDGLDSANGHKCGISAKDFQNSFPVLYGMSAAANKCGMEICGTSRVGVPAWSEPSTTTTEIVTPSEAYKAIGPGLMMDPDKMKQATRAVAEWIPSVLEKPGFEGNYKESGQKNTASSEVVTQPNGTTKVVDTSLGIKVGNLTGPGIKGVSAEVTEKTTERNSDGTTTTTTKYNGPATDPKEGTGWNENPSGNSAPAKDLCAEHPEASACKPLDIPVTSDEIGSKEIPLTLEPVAMRQGSCPADIPLPRGAKWTWQPACDFAIDIKPIVIALGWLAAGYIIFAGRKAQ